MVEQPLVLCIGADEDERARLARLVGDEVGVVVLAADVDSAMTLLSGGRLAGEVEVGHLRVDRDGWTATWRDEPLALTRNELGVLGCLAAAPGRVWRHGDLYRAVWRMTWLGDRSALASAVKRLRRKLKAAGATVEVESVRGVGFRLAA